MLCSECSFNWQDSVAISSYISSLLMDILHDFTDNYQRIDLLKYGINFYEANALNKGYYTLTFDLREQSIIRFFVVGYLRFKSDLFSISFDFLMNLFLSNITIDFFNVLKDRYSNTSVKKLYASLTACFSLFLSQ